MSPFGLLLIAIGIVYLAKPDLFQRGLWKRTAISQRLFTPEQNKVYMRVLGGLFILAGLVLVLVRRH